MKKLIIFSVLIISAFSSCEKLEVYDQLNGSRSIEGISGSIMGWQDVKNFDKLTINQSGSYYVSFNEAEVQRGSYTIEKQKPRKFADYTIEYFIKFNSTAQSDIYSNFYTDLPLDIMLHNNGTLILSQREITDGFNYHFKRTNFSPDKK